MDPVDRSLATQYKMPLVNLDNRTLAIVAAADAYPSGTGLDPLHGAIKDAKAFVSWLKSPSGGSLPSSSIKVFVSDPNFEDAKPSRANVTRYLKDVVNELRDHRDATGEETPIERLYLYLIGHGEQASSTSGNLFVDAAWLGAGFDKNNLDDHLSGAAMAEELKKTGFFKEIVVMMDCCRTKGTLRSVDAFKLQSENGPADLPGFIVMFACEPEQAAYEQKIPGGVEHHGVFSLALNEGLNHKRVAGRLRIPELLDYLVMRMDFLRGHLDPQVPDSLLHGTQAVRIVMASGDHGGPFPVLLDIKSTEPGQDFIIVDPDGQNVTQHPILKGKIPINLQMGNHQVVRSSGEFVSGFTVFPAMEPVEVSFV